MVLGGFRWFKVVPRFSNYVFMHILLLESIHCLFSNLPTVKQKHACLKQQEVQYKGIMQVQWYLHACKLEQNNNCLLIECPANMT